MKTLALLLALTLTVAAGPLDSTSSLSGASKRASPYSADQLVALYEKNAIAANAKMAGQTITLSGYVDQIEKDAIFFVAQKSATYTDIKCKLAPDALAAFAKTKTGARMVITGTVEKMEYSQITLANCRPAK